MAHAIASSTAEHLLDEIPDSLSLIDRLADAVVAKLAADPVISSPRWCGRDAGPVQVYRVPDFRKLPPPADYPCITVAGVNFTEVFMLGEELAHEGRIAVNVLLLENRAIIAPSELGPLSLAAYVLRVLKAGTPAETHFGLLRQPLIAENEVENLPASESQLETGFIKRGRAEFVVPITLRAVFKPTALNGVPYE